MLFPEAERVIYRENVLDQVICQIRFPTILKIDTEVPSAFQELIRHKFPVYQQSNEGDHLQLPDGISQLIPREFLESFTIRGNMRHQFISGDRSWTVSLTRDFIALSTGRYTCWEEFRDNLKLIAQALIDVYAPAYISRVGLRYQNVVDRKKLEFDGMYVAGLNCRICSRAASERRCCRFNRGTQEHNKLRVERSTRLCST